MCCNCPNRLCICVLAYVASLVAVQTLEIICRSEVLLCPEARVKSPAELFIVPCLDPRCLIPLACAKYYAFLRRRLTVTLHYASKSVGGDMGKTDPRTA